MLPLYVLIFKEIIVYDNTFLFPLELQLPLHSNRRWLHSQSDSKP